MHHPLFHLISGKNTNGEDMDEDRIDETPYAEFSVPDLFSQISNNNGCRQYQTKLGSSFTQEDLRIDSHPGLDQKQQISSASQGCQHQSQATISGSGQQQYYVNQRFNNSRNLINKSKSAHIISCEVYSEVADHAAISSTDQNQLNLTTLRTRFVYYHFESN